MGVSVGEGLRLRFGLSRSDSRWVRSTHFIQHSYLSSASSAGMEGLGEQRGKLLQTSPLLVKNFRTVFRSPLTSGMFRHCRHLNLGPRHKDGMPNHRKGNIRLT